MKSGYLVTFLLIVVSLFGCQKNMESADLIIHNGMIWTANPEQPMAKAMAISGDKILAVGDDDEILNKKDPHTEIIDLKSAFVTPGFIDSHVHFIQGGFALASVKLRDAATPEVFISRIGEYAKSIPDGEWIIMGNWNHELWGGELPAKEWIDSVTSNNPVFINRLDGHMALANSLALEIAGISDQVEEMDGGEIIRNEQGGLTGIFKDNAMDLVYAKMPDPNHEQLERAVNAAMKFVASKGVTSIHHMGTFSDQETFESMAISGQLDTRIYSCVPLASWKQLKDKIDTTGVGTAWHRIGGLKGFMDGSLGSHTAAFFEPYDDKPQDKGFYINDLDNMEDWILAADQAELHVVVHAIGDRANHKLLNYYEKALEVNGKRDRRFRIEHAQHLSQEDIPRFKQLGVIASMQPYHAIDDGVWAEKLIGDRIKRTYVFKDLIDSDAMLAFGSDWFVAPPIPLEGIYGAVTRRTLDDKNPEGWVPEQKISVEESLKAYTINGAFASFEEDIKGSLEKGKLADFVVMEKDLFSIPASEIRNVRILQTYVGGKKIYEFE
jgi:predicted amidohydrolase YtcJ